MSTKELKRKGYADAAEIWDDPRAKHSAKSGKNNIRPFWLIKSQPMNKKEMKRKERKGQPNPSFLSFSFLFCSILLRLDILTRCNLHSLVFTQLVAKINKGKGNKWSPHCTLSIKWYALLCTLCLPIICGSDLITYMTWN